jgi:hypothetical protein
VALTLLCVFAAVVIAAVAVATSTSNEMVHFRKIVAHDTQTAVQKIQSVINQYTK